MEEMGSVRAPAGRNFASVPPGIKPDPIYLNPQNAPVRSSRVPDIEGNLQQEAQNLKEIADKYNTGF